MSDCTCKKDERIADLEAQLAGYILTHKADYQQIEQQAAEITQLKTPKGALTVLSKAMQDDPGYAWSWHCNVAMVAQDAGAPHDKANERAADFMSRAFSVDTSKPPAGEE
jgi:hypothetical protein